MSIYNDSAHILQPSSQQAIQNAAAWAELDSVIAEFAYANDDDAVFDIKDENGNYQFSIDTSDDTIFDKNA